MTPENKAKVSAILVPSALYTLVSSGVSAAGLSGAAITTTTLATLGLGLGMTGGLLVLGVVGVVSFELVKKLAEKTDPII